MPSYDYHCPTNGRVVEVKHRMSESLGTWGEVCEKAGLELGETPPEAPVERWIAESGCVGLGGGGVAAGPACSVGPAGFT